MSLTTVDREAIDAVADIYQELLREGVLSHDEVSIFVTNLIGLFFIEDSKMGDDWQDIKSNFDNREITNLCTTGNRYGFINFRELSFDLSPLVWELIVKSRLVEWAKVSPLVFGSSFQGILEMDSKEITEALTHGGGTRREFGAHYTSKENILKVINPLFLDNLRVEMQDGVEHLHQKISELKFLDPAMGCASFLVVIYQELRLLENEILGSHTAISSTDYRVSLDQFYGIEINEQAAAVGRLALIISEHQANAASQNILGYKSSLQSSPNIKIANALRINWNDVLPQSECDYVVGNPPFRGALKMTKSQKEDMKYVGLESNIKSWGSLDLVAGWFVKATLYVSPSNEENHDVGMFDLWEDSPHADVDELATTRNTKIAFVSTNSVSQGLHIPNLWSWIFNENMEIGFAYPSFRWSNDAAGKASVTVVIIAFARKDSFAVKHIYGDNSIRLVDYINGGLTPSQVGAVEPVRGRVLSPGIPLAELGNLPRGKGFIVNSNERAAELARNPALEKWLPLFVGADELTKNTKQYCLWLVDAPDDILNDPFISSRLDDIREQRLISTKKETRDAASTPALFDEIRQPKIGYLAIPTSSSGLRKYIPLKFFPSSVIASNGIKTISGATPYHFAVLSSAMHMAWMRNTSARLGGGNDYSYSVASTYNTYPWLDADEWTTAAISALGSEVLSIRANHLDIPLGKLYTSMPDDLIDAHNKLDALIDASYGYKGDGDDESRFEFLYSHYAKRDPQFG